MYGLHDRGRGKGGIDPMPKPKAKRPRKSARLGPPPLWMFLGDSITIGTQGKCVVDMYQRATYAYRVCEALGLYAHVGAIAEPGLPQRIWTDPVSAAKPGVPNPSAKPWNRATLFVELVLYPEFRGARAEDTLGQLTNILAVDGTEIHQAITQGRWSGGVSGLALDPEARSSFDSDFTLDVLAGLEPENYQSVSESEYGLHWEIMQKGSPRIGERWIFPENRSQTGWAKATRPDAVVIWLGNNDTLQAILNGSSIQARVTPCDAFDRALHRTELGRLQPLRKAGLGAIPTVFGSMNDALDRLQFVTFRESLDHILRELETHPAEDGAAPRPRDVVLATLPDDTQVPLLVPLTDEATLGDLLGEDNRFPFRVVVFGLDVTDDLFALKVSAKVLEYDGGQGRETPSLRDHRPGTKVSLLTILARFSTLLADLTDDSDIQECLVKTALFFVRAFAGPGGVRDTVRSKFEDFWNGVRSKLPDIRLRFRDDEVLTPQDQIKIRTEIGRYNAHIRSKESPHHAVFDMASRFDEAVSMAGYAVHAHRTASPVDTIRATWRGGIFSMDGGHPGNYGHAVIASELLHDLGEHCREFGRDSFGGIDVSQLHRFSKTKLAAARASDEVLHAVEKRKL